MNTLQISRHITWTKLLRSEKWEKMKKMKKKKNENNNNNQNQFQTNN